MTRLLFIGLWTQADRDGRLEDRPKRLKAEIFPYENYDIEKGLNELQSAGFIIRYKVNVNASGRVLAPEQPVTELALVQIVTFSKHQRFTGKEAAEESIYPPPHIGEVNVKHWEATGKQLGTQEGNKEGNGDKGRERETVPELSGNSPPVKTENPAPQTEGAAAELPIRHLVPLMLETWLAKLPDYPQDSEKDNQALGGLSRFIAKVKKEPYEPDNSKCVDTILTSWSKVAEFVSKDDFYKSFSLHQVERHIQNILQRMKNGRSKTGTENQKPTGVAVPSGPRTYGRL